MWREDRAGLARAYAQGPVIQIGKSSEFKGAWRCTSGYKWGYKWGNCTYNSYEGTYNLPMNLRVVITGSFFVTPCSENRCATSRRDSHKPVQKGSHFWESQLYQMLVSQKAAATIGS